MEIRRASDGNLSALVAVLGQRHFFADCLARQRGGHGVLLVAWLDGRPVSDVFLSWEPADEPEVRRLYERLGYVDWGHGTVVGIWRERDHDGPPVTLSETLDTLVKCL